MKKDRFGIPRPLVPEDFVLRFVLDGTTQRRMDARNAVKDTANGIGFSVESSSVYTEEGNTIVDLAIEANRVTLTEVTYLKDDVEAVLTASDLRLGVLEVVIG